MTGAVVVDIPLRWSDMDAQGHVNNVRISEPVSYTHLTLPTNREV